MQLNLLLSVVFASNPALLMTCTLFTKFTNKTNDLRLLRMNKVPRMDSSNRREYTASGQSTTTIRSLRDKLDNISRVRKLKILDTHSKPPVPSRRIQSRTKLVRSKSRVFQ
ncbi:hypothetical protein BDW66DRAFT_141121 [Aspergillus desertorum]